jgi:hypothetical protein
VFLGGCVFLAALIIGGSLVANRGMRVSIGPSTPAVPQPEGSLLVAIPPMTGVARPVADVQAAPSDSAALDGHTALVLRDPIALTAPISDVVQEQLDRLKSSGLDLCGVDDAGLTPEEASRSTELAADLRHALGLAPFQSSAAEESLHRWMLEHDGVDMVVWVGRDPESGEGAATWIIPAPGLDPGVLTATRDALTP